MKNKSLSIIILVLLGVLALTGCKKEGCTDSSAINHDSSAKKNDGSCIYEGITEIEIRNCDLVPYEIYIDAEPKYSVPAEDNNNNFNCDGIINLTIRDEFNKSYDSKSHSISIRRIVSGSVVIYDVLNVLIRSKQEYLSCKYIQNGLFVSANSEPWCF